MDAAAPSSEQHGTPAYTTSKQVQAWFLRRSRDLWKNKYAALKVELKRFRQRVADLDRSRAQWRRQAEETGQQLEALQAENARLRTAVDATTDAGKKNAPLPARVNDPTFDIRPASHGYPCGVISLFLRFVQAGIASRGTSRVLALLADAFGAPFGAPHWTTGRLWLQRFGLAQLQAPKERAPDWVGMIDHSVPIGTQKVLVILGIRLKDLPPPGQCLTHDHMELIALEPMESSTRQDVADRLERAARSTCVPRAIVDDHGVDLTGGVALFQRAHPETVEIYDIKHKAACLLKARLEKSPRWQAFTAWVARVRCAIQQTELAALVPPGARPKARFMNLGPQLNWAEKVLAVVDHRPAVVLEQTTAARLEEKLGEVRQYRAELAEWRQYQELVDETVDFVGAFGLGLDTPPELHQLLGPGRLSGASRELAEDLIGFVEEQSGRARPGEWLPGSTEVLESCFGKYKALEKGQSQGGFTGLLAGFGSLLAEATSRTVEPALRVVPTQEVRGWCAEHLGKTVFTQRREAFAAATKAQQKMAEADT